MFDIPLIQIPGATTPVLIINGEISIFALLYARYLQQLGYASGTISKKLESVGRLWDFYLSTPTHIHNKNFLKSFCEARINGTTQLNGSDPTKLNWVAPQYDTAIRDFRHVSDYMEFAAANFDTVSLNPLEKAYQGSVEYARQHERKKKTSLLYCNTVKNKFVYKRQDERRDRFGQASRKNITYKHFPPQKVADFIKVQNTTRDKMIVLLLFFGGIRISEVLHIFIFDITKDKDNTAKITLVNPLEGKQQWNDNNGVRKKGTRRNYLSEKYGLLPRNLLSPNDGLYVGWKGMSEDDSSRRTSYVKWIIPEFGEMFLKLYKQYIKETASYRQNHPYCFIAQNGKTKGQPLRMTSLINHLLNKFEKIDLNFLDSSVHPHTMRHYYGYYAANVLKLPSETVKEMMHHESISSTEIYFQLAQETIREELERGYKKIAISQELKSCIH